VAFSVLTLSSKRLSWRAAVALCARALVVAAVTGMVLPWISHALSGHDGRIAWAVDLAAHWQWLFLTVLVLGALLGATLHRGWLFALLLSPLPWWSASSRMDDAHADGAGLTVAAVNVHVSTRDASALARWLASTWVDLVVVSEVSPAFAASLARLPGFPHREIAPADHPFGIAVLSRFPMRAVAVRDAQGTTHVEARVDTGVGCVEVFAVHPIPPMTPHLYAARNHRLRDVAGRTTQQDVPRLVVGDLNATPWSSAFSILSKHGLRRASTLRPTWPSRWHGWFGIPIDHVAGSAHWRVREARLGPHLGSDHRPLLAELTLAESVDGKQCDFD
jgi:endonuclease/exonuclease/phosphatase (EEP) superfamily protein YafD